MGLFEQVNADIIAAMKAKESDKLGALRAIKAQLLLIKTSGEGSDQISEEEGIKMLQKMVKQRKDSADIYKTQNRDDLYKKEMSEVSYIQVYLPKQMDLNELTQVIKGIIEKLGAESMKDMGKVMGAASKELAGKAEGKLIAEKVKELLNS